MSLLVGLVIGLVVGWIVPQPKFVSDLIAKMKSKTE